MTDAHCHVSADDPGVHELLIGRDFFGWHPWSVLSEPTLGVPLPERMADLRRQLQDRPAAGVGEIGLDRLRSRDIPPAMRQLFTVQLALAHELRRPVVLHGAKCWGQVVAELKRPCEKTAVHARIPFLFHGFSRSDGLMPDIVALNGFVSVGPAVLNDHAVNYRSLVKKIPLDRILIETDRDEANAATCPDIRSVLIRTAALRELSADRLEALTDANADRFMNFNHTSLKTL